MKPIHRRTFLHTSAGFLSAAAFAPLGFSEDKPKPAPAAGAAPKKPPALELDKVKAIVGAAHSSLDKVRELVAETPLLVNACLDQGGGDFETPLQAAAHTGRRPIAEFLLAQNARADIYAAGMLGLLDEVKATLAANPAGLLAAAAVPGPHGFTLLHCAKQGGEQAKPVYDWLLAQGVPAVFQRPLPYKWPAGTAPV